MFGCLGRIGCLLLVVLALAGAWLYRDKFITVERGGGKPGAVATAPAWEPVSDAGAARARTAIESLGRKSGPVFANVQPGDLASYILIELSKQLPPSAENVEATIMGDRVAVRARVNLADFGQQALGPLAMMLGSHERMLMAGTFDVIHPGLAQFRVQELKFGDLTVPGGAIPKLIAQLDRGKPRPPGVAPNGLPLAIPSYIGDVRVGKGKITLYKTTP
jgi:hypothetical protein